MTIDVNELTPEALAELLAGMIDHTLLKPEATPEQIRHLCDEGRIYEFASVVVNPVYVPLCSELLKGSPVKVCSVIGFPLGASTTEDKVHEARQAIEQGAHEVDMVIQIGLLKAGEDDTVREDIRRVVQASHPSGVLVKVIIETALLTDAEKERACRLAVEAGADFVKTSTGFSSAGATVEDVALMRRIVGPKIGVKAAGGIRSLADALGMIAAGANRLGASAGVQIVEAAKKKA